LAFSALEPLAFLASTEDTASNNTSAINNTTQSFRIATSVVVVFGPDPPGPFPAAAQPSEPHSKQQLTKPGWKSTKPSPMKFGETLLRLRIEKWQDHYVNYHALKKQISKTSVR
jgi:hypothetical protein